MTSPDTARQRAAAEIAELVVAGKRICLTTHVNADGDGLGSEVAMVHLLRQLGAQVCVTNPTPVPPRFAFLFDDIADADAGTRAVKELRRADAIIVLDIADLSRLGGLAETVRDRGVPVACVDHHVSPGTLPEGPRFVDPSAAATGELIYLLAREAGWALTAPAARALYVALVTDTGSFRFSNTRPRTLRIAGDLLEAGVDPEQVYLDVYAGAPAGTPPRRGAADTGGGRRHRPGVGHRSARRIGTSRRRSGRPRRRGRARPIGSASPAGDALSRDVRPSRQGVVAQRR
jgi:phosphoesterase RecJ-like protein